MDSKRDTIFLDEAGRWYLGDFGSMVNEDSRIRSTTQLLCPERISPETVATWRFDWFRLLVVVVVARETFREKFNDNFASEDLVHMNAAKVLLYCCQSLQEKDMIKRFQDNLP